MTLMIPAISIKAALAGFAALGLDTEALLNRIGLERATLNDPFAAVPNEAFAQLWVAAFAQRPEATLPTRAGLAVPFNEFGLLDHLVMSATTIGEGLHILNLFLWLVSTNMSLRFTHGRGDWVFVENSPRESSGSISEQWTLAVVYERFRTQIPPFSIEEVHLAHAAADDARQFTELWGVPVHLGQRATGFRLSDGIWEQPNAQSNPHLKQTLRTVAEQVELKQIVEAPLVYAIRTRLPAALQNGAFSAQDIATELGLSKRTLQRRLSARNLSFKELLDIYRQEQAMFLMQNRDQDLASIAYALGYNEQSSFNRAFRRWTGQSPTQWLSTAAP